MYNLIEKPWGTESIIGFGDSQNPFCIKHIIAKGNLSLQIHFDKEETFFALENSAIFVLDAKELFLLVKNTTYDTFKKIITSGTILNKLTKINILKGSTFIIKPYTLHYIESGSNVLEYSTGPGSIKDNSTFRLLDWYVPKRNLHIEYIYNKIK